MIEMENVMEIRRNLEEAQSSFSLFIPKIPDGSAKIDVVRICYLPG